jgi:hypothetical protein
MDDIDSTNSGGAARWSEVLIDNKYDRRSNSGLSPLRYYKDTRDENRIWAHGKGGEGETGATRKRTRNKDKGQAAAAYVQV